MIVTRISTYNTHRQTLNDAGSVQGRLFELQKQISSGHKTDRFEGLYGEVEAFTSLDDKMQRANEFVKNIKILGSRMNLMSKSLENVTDAVTEMRNIILLRRNGTAADNMGFSEQLQEVWKTVAGQLNTSVEGRYLFGGIRTDQRPVNADDFPTLYNDTQQPEAGYYQGATSDIQMRLQDDYDISLNVRADDPAIQKIYAAFAVAKQGHETSNDALLATSFDLMSDGLTELSHMQVKLGTVQTTMDSVSQQQDQLSLYWKGIKESLINTDLVSASSEVAIQQSILQASFQAFARINSLQLSDFLR